MPPQYTTALPMHHKSMKCFLIAMFVMTTCGAFAQQGNPLPIVHQKMEALKWLSGKWEGTAYLFGQEGMKQEVTHHLVFAPRLKRDHVSD